jgi:uncharacterized protein YciI
MILTRQVVSLSCRSVDGEGWSIGLVRTGRMWDANSGLGAQKLVGEHVAYLGRLIDAGKVTQAGSVIGTDEGPAADGLIALIVYAVDAEQAAALAQSDPAVRGGLIALDIRPWYTAV